MQTIENNYLNKFDSGLRTLCESVSLVDRSKQEDDEDRKIGGVDEGP